ncbi:MAG: PorV/PorQ family protein [Gemmatimonadales bacterium]
MLAVAVLLTARPAARLSAQGQPLNSGALFLVFPVGAEAVGMGQTGVALDGRGEAAFWNPAGLATLEDKEFALHTATLAAGRTHVVSAYFPSSRLGVLGGAVYLVDYGDLESTDSSGATVGRLSPRNFEFLASYATTLGGAVALGINYKLVQFRTDCSGTCGEAPSGDGVTHALDLGGQFALGPAHALRIGVALRHVGFALQVQNKEQADPLPARLAVGARYRIALRPLGDDGERLDLRVAADFDSPWGSYEDAEMRLGFDLGFREFVRLRGGYAFVEDGLSGPSVGLGVTSGSIGVDLARSFLSGTELVVSNPTFFSFRVAF